MTDWIGETFRSDEGWSLLETLVDDGPRLAGTDGERRAAEAVRDALDRHARDARLEPFDVQGWERVDAGVAAGETVQDCIGLPRSPDATATGRLVDVGHGLPDDFADADLEGAVVLARSDAPEWYERYVHRREKYYRAVDAGAVGFVYRNHVPGQLPATGSVGSPDTPVGPVPAVGVSDEVGARLARRFAGEDVTVRVDADVYDATSQNVHAAVGPRTGERVLVTSHVDAHDIGEGAVDNGAGTAVLLEVAKALATREDELDCPVEFVAFGAEEVGLVGSTVDADGRDPTTVRAVLNLDGVCRGRTLSVTTNGGDRLADAVRAVGERFDHPVDVNPRHGPHSDHWPYVVRGVPGVHVRSETEGRGRGWGHTAADTLEKVDVRTLREQAVLLAELAVRVAGDDFDAPRLDPDDVAAALEDAGLAEGMRVAGDWPFDGR